MNIKYFKFLASEGAQGEAMLCMCDIIQLWVELFRRATSRGTSKESWKEARAQKRTQERTQERAQERAQESTKESKHLEVIHLEEELCPVLHVIQGFSLSTANLVLVIVVIVVLVIVLVLVATPRPHAQLTPAAHHSSKISSTSCTISLLTLGLAWV